MSSTHSVPSGSGWRVPAERFLEKPRWVVLAVIALQIFFYSISWNQFFCGDSLYYLSRQTQSWKQVEANFLKEDDVGQYRPLTYPVFTYLVFPIGNLTPRVYHWIGLAVHVVVSTIVFWLLNALLLDYGAALAGYVFFALHSVAYFITYDMTFLSDWLFAGFAMGILVCYMQFLRTHRKGYYLSALLLFPPALLSKETAVMVPLSLFALSMAVSCREKGRSEKVREFPPSGIWAAIGRTAPFAAISVLYLWFLIEVKGRLYPESQAHPFHFTFSLSRVGLDYKFLLWTFNVDFRALATWTDWLPLLIYLPQAGLALWVALRLWKNGRKRLLSGWLLLCGGAFLVPVLPLVEPPYPHHLYMPLVAWSGVAGLAFAGMEKERAVGRRLLALILCLNLASSYLTMWRFNEKSWVAHGSRVASNFLTSLKRHHPTLPQHSVIHLRKSKESNSVWYFDRHTLVQYFYGDPSLSMRFEDLGEALPPLSRPPLPNYFIYGFWDGNLDLLPDYWKGRSTELMDWALQGEVTEDRSQYYPRFDNFGTPNGRRIFHHLLLSQGERRRTLVTIAGTRLRIPLPYIEPGSRLHVGLSSVYNEGDGFGARLSIEHDGQKTTLIDRYLHSLGRVQDRGWLDYHLDLSGYAGSNNFLILECNAGPAGKTEADWLAWSMLAIDKEETR